MFQTEMEALLKETLNTSTLKRTGQGGGGCINQGEAFITDTGTFFVKSNGKTKVSYILYIPLKWDIQSSDIHVHPRP